MTAKKNTRQFKAEISQLLDIITHSIYTNREIFLRELVSNASDALDKLRFLQSSGSAVAAPDTALEIRITPDEEARTLTITDTGIGMTSDELIKNIGTIAHSGSAEFMKQATEAEATDPKAGLDGIIGRFGVGFYSVFMVADEVSITTRAAAEDATPVRWTSSGTGSYTLEDLDEDHPRGTTIAITLKEDAKEYATTDRLRDIIRAHSNFISFPILLAGERINTTPALWREPKFKITTEQYADFYKFLTYDSKAPFEHLHIAVDAPVQFTSLLFIPDAPSANFFQDPDNYGLDLYVRRVLITRSHKELLPQYLGFLSGLVDTEDLPLNLSRETLQENLLISKIKQTIIKQALAMLHKMAEDKERYDTFWQNHGQVFKLGYSDYVNREKFAELLRFNSSTCEDSKGLISLAEYKERAKDGQKAVYYISGPSREAIRLSPHLEIFTQRGIEVLYCSEPADEFILDSLHKYGDLDLTPAEKADPADLEQFPLVDGVDKDAPEELDADNVTAFETMLSAAKDILGDKVEAVRVSRRLKGSPACLVSPDGGLSSQMHKYMQIMTKDNTPPIKVMELNRDHPLVRTLLRIHKSDADDAFFKTSVEQLYESALLLDGYLNDPHALVARVNSLLENASNWYAEIKHL